VGVSELNVVMTKVADGLHSRPSCRHATKSSPCYFREFSRIAICFPANKRLFAGDVFSRHRGKFLQLHVTIEDDGVFTTPWTATLTYVPGGDQVPEEVCAENIHQYYYDHSDANVPRAEKPDF
jgi:hypothetical protein